MRFVSFVLASLVLAAAVPLASAQTLTDPNPANREWVETTLTIEQPDLTTLDISGAILVRKYVVDGTPYESSDDIGSAYQQLVAADDFARSQGQTSNRAGAFVSDIEQNATRALRETLERNFPDAQITIEPAVLDRATLASPSGNAYDPGVALSIGARVVRGLDDVGLGDLSLDAARAAFDAGATVGSELALSANPGHHVTYNIAAPADPAGLVFSNAGPADVASLSGGKLVVDIDNEAGAAIRSATASFVLSDPAAVANAPTAEDISASITIQLGEIKEGLTALPVTAAVRSDVSAIDVEKRFPAALPASVTLAFLSADALRALHQTGAVSEADIEEANAQLRGAISDSLESVIPGATVSGGLLVADLAATPASPFSTTPPIGFEASAAGNYDMPDGSENADLALLIGATLKFDLDLPSSDDRDTSIVVIAPPGTVFATASGGTLAADKKSASFLVPLDPAEAPLKASLALRDPDARTYTQADADNGAKFGAVLDLQDIDISIGKAIGGDFGSLIGEVAVTAEMGVFEIPEEFQGALPSNVELSFLTSDALRLLHARDVVTEQQVADLERAFMENVTKNLRDALQVEVNPTGGLAEGTLDATGITTPSGDKPVKLEARASFVKPLSGAPAETAATTLMSVPQSFTLPSVEGLATTYKVILPKGISVSDLQVDHGTSETGTEGGREYFIVTPEKGEEATASMNVGVTPTFVVAKFWPILLLAVLIVFLIVGTPIALIVLRRRKKKAE